MRHQRTCETCGQAFDGRSDARYCQRSCYTSRKQRTEAGRRQYLDTACTWCGKQCRREMARGHDPSCSTSCQNAIMMFKAGRAQNAWPRTVKCRTCDVRVTVYSGRKNVQCADCQPQAEPFDARCCECGQGFTDTRYPGSSPSLYCSDTCRNRIKDRNRRARLTSARRAPVRRQDIYDRDGLQCYLCGDQLDSAHKVPHPKAPTLDHVIPLAKGGTDEPGNVATACFTCNVRKGDRLAS